jgi:hypothetical protein
LGTGSSKYNKIKQNQEAFVFPSAPNKNSGGSS